MKAAKIAQNKTYQGAKWEYLHLADQALTENPKQIMRRVNAALVARFPDL